MSWQRDASEVRYVWPHRVAENRIRMTVSAKSVHQGDVVAEWQSNNWQSGTTGIVDANARWDLYAVANPWSQLEIDLALSVDDVPALRNHVLPPGENHPVSFAVAIRCARTRWRQFAAHPFHEGSASLKLTLPADQLFGEVELIPWIVLDRNVRPQDPFAATRLAVIATGFPASIWADEPQDRPGRGLPRTWIPFGAESKDALYKLAFESDIGALTPTLYINSNHPTLKAIIDYRGKKQPTAAARDAIFTLMASEIWMELAAFAGDVMEQGLEPDNPKSKVAERIIKTLKKKVKRNKSDIVDAFGDEDRRSDLNVRIQNWLKAAVRQTELVNAFGQEASNE
jgi:hypothetical protein